MALSENLRLFLPSDSSRYGQVIVIHDDCGRQLVRNNRPISGHIALHADLARMSTKVVVALVASVKICEEINNKTYENAHHSTPTIEEIQVDSISSTVYDNSNNIRIMFNFLPVINTGRFRCSIYTEGLKVDFFICATIYLESRGVVSKQRVYCNLTVLDCTSTSSHLYSSFARRATDCKLLNRTILGLKTAINRSSLVVGELFRLELLIPRGTLHTIDTIHIYARQRLSRDGREQDVQFDLFRWKNASFHVPSSVLDNLLVVLHDHVAALSPSTSFDGIILEYTVVMDVLLSTLDHPTRFEVVSTSLPISIHPFRYGAKDVFKDSTDLSFPSVKVNEKAVVVTAPFCIQYPPEIKGHLNSRVCLMTESRKRNPVKQQYQPLIEQLHEDYLTLLRTFK